MVTTPFASGKSCQKLDSSFHIISCHLALTVAVKPWFQGARSMEGVASNCAASFGCWRYVRSVAAVESRWVLRLLVSARSAFTALWVACHAQRAQQEVILLRLVRPPVTARSASTVHWGSYPVMRVPQAVTPQSQEPRPASAKLGSPDRAVIHRARQRAVPLAAVPTTTATQSPFRCQVTAFGAGSTKTLTSS